jgi:Clp amino terminal domain, pathogenicity island component
VYLDATAEAKRCGDRRVGTEHLVLALLADPHSAPARVLGVDLASTRAALAELDRQALAYLGIHPTFSSSTVPGRPAERLRLTPSARSVFTGLARTRLKGERTGPAHVLLALLTLLPPDPAAVLLDALRVDRAEVRARLDRP